MYSLEGSSGYATSSAHLFTDKMRGKNFMYDISFNEIKVYQPNGTTEVHYTEHSHIYFFDHAAGTKALVNVTDFSECPRHIDACEWIAKRQREAHAFFANLLHLEK